MPRIKINANGHGHYGTGQRISFSLSSSPKDGRRQIREFMTCRDYINDCLISFFTIMGGNKRGNDYWKKDHAPVDSDNLRLIITKDLGPGETEESLRGRLYSAKRILNMYEEYAGFENRSVLSRADHSSDRIKYCWILTGPGEWMKASNLVSMVTLIFRVVVNSGGFEDFTTLDEVEARFKTLCYPNLKEWTDLGDLLPTAWPKFRMLMKYYDRLFRSKPLEFWYPQDCVTDWHGSGGIRTLCSFKVRDAAINKEMISAWKDWQESKDYDPSSEALRLESASASDDDYDDDDDEYYDDDDDYAEEDDDA
jgi:hypothetical protein